MPLLGRQDPTERRKMLFYDMIQLALIAYVADCKSQRIDGNIQWIKSAGKGAAKKAVRPVPLADF